MIVNFFPDPLLMISVLYTKTDKEIPDFKLNIIDLTEHGDFMKSNK